MRKAGIPMSGGFILAMGLGAADRAVKEQENMSTDIEEEIENQDEEG